MIQFHSHDAIYLQIADYICEKILKKEWTDNDRIPAVREIAIDVQVNPNTVVRTYAYLEENGIIYKQRGIGYFIAENAYKKTQELIKKDFLENELPAILKKMELLGIDFDEINSSWAVKGTVPARGQSPEKHSLVPEQKKQTIATENKPASPPAEKLTYLEDETGDKIETSSESPSDKSMSWD